MKKVMGCVGFFAVLAIVMVVILFWAGSTSEVIQKEFYDAIVSQDPGKVFAMFHPSLVAEIDEPVLLSYMKFFKETFGVFKEIRKTDFSASTNYNNGRKETTIKGTVVFEKGEAKSELQFIDGKLISFATNSPLLKAWLSGLPTTKLYQERSEAFLKAFPKTPDESFKLMHEALQKEVPPEKLKNMSSLISEKFGAVKKVTFKSEEFASKMEPPQLRQTFVLECEKGEAGAEVAFVFPGFKGSIISFDIK